MTTATNQTGDWLGHPKGLFVLFATEMWERFSYYGMRALLIFYLTKYFLFTDSQASQIYGSYTALVYVLPIIGGILADRYLGAKKSVTFGAILIALGHITLAIEGPAHVEQTVSPSDPYLQLFFLGLALISAGTGFLKANISTIVGSLYSPADSRRDGGFTIFYMGINLGSVMATLICGYLGETYGWNYGFGAAGAGMIIGLVVFLAGQKHLKGISDPAQPELLKQKKAGISKEYWIYLGGLLMVAVSWKLVQHHEIVGSLLTAAIGIMSIIIIYYALRKCNKVERDRLFAASIMIFFSVVFWALFEQAGSSLSLLTDRVIERTAWGVEIKASQFQALNPAFIIFLAPLFSIMWVWLNKRGWEPSTPTKFALAIFQVGLGFLILVSGMQNSLDNEPVAMVWIILLYLVHTTGELCLSPVGLSMITKLSVARIAGMMMGVWFLASSTAQYIAGALSALTGSGEYTPGTLITLADTKAAYIPIYTKMGWVAVGIGMFLLLIVPLVKKLMHKNEPMIEKQDRGTVATAN